MTYTTPHQIRLMSRLLIIGITKGNVKNSIDQESKNIPMKKYMMKNSTRIPYLPIGRLITKSLISGIIPAELKTWDIKVAIAMMNKEKEVTLTVSSRLRLMI